MGVTRRVLPGKFFRENGVAHADLLMFTADKWVKIGPSRLRASFIALIAGWLIKPIFPV
jgi:hypothetical protein